MTNKAQSGPVLICALPYLKKYAAAYHRVRMGCGRGRVGRKQKREGRE